MIFNKQTRSKESIRNENPSMKLNSQDYSNQQSRFITKNLEKRTNVMNKRAVSQQKQFRSPLQYIAKYPAHIMKRIDPYNQSTSQRSQH